MDSKPDLKQLYSVAALISCFFIAGVFMYGHVAWRHSETGQTGILAPETMTKSHLIFWGISLVAIAVIPMIKSYILNMQSPSQTLPMKGAGYAKLLIASVMGMAISEVPAFCGLVLFFLTGKMSDYLSLASLSLIGFAIHFPRFQQWNNWIESQPQ